MVAAPVSNTPKKKNIKSNKKTVKIIIFSLKRTSMQVCTQSTSHRRKSNARVTRDRLLLRQHLRKRSPPLRWLRYSVITRIDRYQKLLITPQSNPERFLVSLITSFQLVFLVQSSRFTLNHLQDGCWFVLISGHSLICFLFRYHFFFFL